MSKFVLEDRGSPVEFRIDAVEEATLVMDISGSSRDCLLRVHLPDNIPAMVDLNELTGLDHHLDEDSFNQVSSNGWWFNKECSLLWIRLTGRAKEDHLTIEMQK